MQLKKNDLTQVWTVFYCCFCLPGKKSFILHLDRYSVQFNQLIRNIRNEIVDYLNNNE